MSGDEGGVVRIIWPILDESLTGDQLIARAAAELPMLITQAHAIATGPGRFHVKDSRDVPGSGRVSNLVLVFEAPADQAPPRPYWTKTRDVATCQAQPKRRPVDDVDDNMVRRVLDGDWAEARHTTRAERTLITRAWTARGGTLAALRDHTGWKVDRYLEPVPS